MKKIVIISIFLFVSIINAHAIKPSKAYNQTPKILGLKYEEIKIHTSDSAIINVWHLPSDSLSSPIIIAESDAGNMGDWLYLGLFLQAFGHDVWMFDYRGFGESSDFKIPANQLFCNEFITDLQSVVDYVYDKTSFSPILMGLSMGK